jgi:type IV pilus assembly protein PilW
VDAKLPSNCASRDQRGFTLLELMIALTIGIFLLGALLIIVQTNKTVFGNQNKLSQLQDSERMALTMITDVIQSAGYFPDPTINTQSSALTAVGLFASGQAISGTHAAAAPGDQINVRYMTASGDNILNCSGQSNVTGANTLYVNSFQIVGNQLVCTMNGTDYNLVSGVMNLQILYGVKANLIAVGNDVDTYMSADQVTAALLWNNVITVMVNLTFTNPLYVAAAPQGQPATIQIQRVVGVMNQTGPML